MSQLSQALNNLQASIAESLLTGTLTGSVSAGISTLLAANPSLTLSEAITNINGDITNYLNQAISKLPGWEQVIAQILLIAESTNIQNWIDGIITQVYTKLVSQLAGTAAATQIIATGTASAAPALSA
jgi:hypothetical protein